MNVLMKEPNRLPDKSTKSSKAADANRSSKNMARLMQSGREEFCWKTPFSCTKAASVLRFHLQADATFHRSVGGSDRTDTSAVLTSPCS